MIVLACNQEFEGSPEEIVTRLRELLAFGDIAPDTEGYIKYVQRAYKTLFSEDLPLKGNLESRIISMLYKLEGVGLLEVLEE